MKELFRPVLRQVLKVLTILVLRKHKPTVIAIEGLGQTSIAREVIYAVIQTTFPVRRNQESPEAEFSVPLTILAYPRYPSSTLEWLWVLLKTVLQLFTIKPFYHFLVLELNAPNPEIVEYWKQIVKPSKSFVVSEYPDSELMEPHFELGWEVADEFGIAEQKVLEVLSTFSLPEARIDIRKGRNGSLVLDATHYYIPIKLDAILELIPAEAKRLIYFGKDRTEMQRLRQLDSRWVFNPLELDHAVEDVIVLRGSRTQTFPLYRHLMA